MTIEEIRKGAPLGATNYEIDEDGYVWYYKLGFMHFNEKWIPVLQWFNVENETKPLY